MCTTLTSGIDMFSTARNVMKKTSNGMYKNVRASNIWKRGNIKKKVLKNAIRGDDAPLGRSRGIRLKGIRD